MPAAKAQIRQIIADNNLNSVAYVYSLLKDSFKDILQELMEVELDASLGYEKTQKGDAQIQRRVIHMLCNSFKYVNYNNLKKFSSDFKAVYNASNEVTALSKLEKSKKNEERNICIQ